MSAPHVAPIEEYHTSTTQKQRYARQQKNGFKRANLLNPLIRVSRGELPCKRLRCDDAARLLFTAHGGGSHHDLGNILLAGEVEHRLL